MKLRTETVDPLGVLASTRGVVEGAQFVSIHEGNLQEIAKLIKDRFGSGIRGKDMAIKAGGSDDSLQLIFLEDATNFCFWADKDSPRWQVEKADGATTTGGWYGLAACFERGIQSGFPILDAHYLSALSLEDGARFFEGAHGVQIPLLAERVENLREAGTVLLEKFNGKFANLFRASNYDPITVAKLTIENFPSFRDTSTLDGRNILFYKRAQILAQDMSYVLRATDSQFHGLDQLTGFADYKLPQMFRMWNVFAYKPELAERIDHYVEIAHDSREEIEIRAATVWAVELLRQNLPGMLAADIDNTIWLMSQDVQTEAKPYHRTRTIFY